MRTPVLRDFVFMVYVTDHRTTASYVWLTIEVTPSVILDGYYCSHT